MIRRGLEWGVQGAVVLVLGALIVGQLLGQPVLLGFVETGSMEPTIETGDGFVAIPSAVADDPEVGDVVVFDAEAIEGGELTTHRVVDETERGYITQGDANPFTDQDSDEPPVQDGQVVAIVLQVNENPITIPKLGTAVMTVGDVLERGQRWLATTFGVQRALGTTGLAYLLLGVSVALYALETARERREPTFDSSLGRDEEATVVTPRMLAGGCALLVLVAAGAAMVAPAGTQSYDVISAEFDSEQPLVIERGTTDEVPYVVHNGGFVPVVSYVEPGSDNVAVDSAPATVGPREGREIPVSITAPDETGYYPAYVTEYRYLHVLPRPVIDALYDVHPWVPFVAICSLLGGGFYALGRLLLGRDDPRARARRRAARNRGVGRRRRSSRRLRRWWD